MDTPPRPRPAAPRKLPRAAAAPPASLPSFPVSCLATLQPLLDHLPEHGERHGGRRESDVVEVADVELRAEAPACLGAQREPAGVPDLVAARLARPGAVA